MLGCCAAPVVRKPRWSQTRDWLAGVGILVVIWPPPPPPPPNPPTPSLHLRLFPRSRRLVFSSEGSSTVGVLNIVIAALRVSPRLRHGEEVGRVFTQKYRRAGDMKGEIQKKYVHRKAFCGRNSRARSQRALAQPADSMPALYCEIWSEEHVWYTRHCSICSISYCFL